jgi:hypothetical protein
MDGTIYTHVLPSNGPVCDVTSLGLHGIGFLLRSAVAV